MAIKFPLKARFMHAKVDQTLEAPELKHPPFMRFDEIKGALWIGAIQGRQGVRMMEHGIWKDTARFKVEVRFHIVEDEDLVLWIEPIAREIGDLLGVWKRKDDGEQWEKVDVAKMTEQECTELLLAIQETWDTGYEWASA